MSWKFRMHPLGIIILLLFSSYTGTAFAEMKKAELKVPGIVCASAGIRAAEAALSVKGVSDAVDNMSNSRLTVIFDDKIAEIDAIRKALKEAGYPAEGEPQYLE